MYANQLMSLVIMLKLSLDWIKKTISERILLYVALTSILSAVAIASFQLQRGELELNPLKIMLLMFVSIALFLTLKKRCDREAFKFAFLVTVYAIVAYLAWPTRPWIDWYDQSYYLRMTRELSQGYLSSGSYRYGIGYPLLAAPFYNILGNDSLFIPNLVALAGTIYFSYLLFRSITNNVVAKIAVLLLIFATTLASHYIIWWGHGIVIFSLMLVSYLAIKPLSQRNLFIIGFLIGYSFFTRYFDIIVFLPIVFYVIWRARVKGLILMVAGVLPMITATFYSHLVVFGDLLMTPYSKLALINVYGTPWFVPELIPYHSFLTFLYFPADLAHSTFGLGTLKMPVLIGTFYFIFAPVGAFALWKDRSKRNFLLAMITSTLFCIIYSTSYFQFHSGTFGPFPADFRYLLPAYPYLVLLSVIGLLSFIGMYPKQVGMMKSHLDKIGEGLLQDVNVLDTS